jgi:actin related protein 2/3 complex subunit 2
MAQSKQKGMIFLDPGNQIIEETMRTKMENKAEPVDIRISDFDGVMFRLFVDQADLTTMFISVYMPVLGELRNYGGQVLLDQSYPGMAVEPPHEGYHLTLGFSITEPHGGKEELIKKISQLKRNLMGAPFDQCFGALVAGQAGSLPPIQIHYRKTETLYVVPQPDRIIIIFAVDFVDHTDVAIAKVFLQEFAEAQRQVNGSPPVGFSKDAPMELNGVGDLPSVGVGFISFALFASHVQGDKRDLAVTMIQGFRSYLHYHIKATKSYLHTCMRRRVTSLLQVLNRAVPDKEVGDVKKKTASGKTFTRK